MGAHDVHTSFGSEGTGKHMIFGTEGTGRDILVSLPAVRFPMEMQIGMRVRPRFSPHSMPGMVICQLVCCKMVHRLSTSERKGFWPCLVLGNSMWCELCVAHSASRLCTSMGRLQVGTMNTLGSSSNSPSAEADMELCGLSCCALLKTQARVVCLSLFRVMSTVCPQRHL